MLRSFWIAVPILVSTFSAQSALSQGVTNLASLDDAELEQTINFVVSNSVFALYNQMADIMIGELGFKTPENTRNTSDELASVLLLEENQEFLDTALVQATDSWYLARNAKVLPQYSEPLHVEIIPNQVRDKSIACLMIGKDRSGYSDLAESMGLKADEWTQCVIDYPKKVGFWNNTLRRYQSDESIVPFELSFDIPVDPELEIYATIIQQSNVFELIMDQFDTYKFKGPMKISAKSCGRPDVYWSEKSRQITYCYEHAKYHAELISAHLQGLLSGNGMEAEEDNSTSVNLNSKPL